MAVDLGVKINWIFTEAGHGKLAADDIGGNIKNKAQEKQNMEPDLVMRTAADVMKNIETNIEMRIHTKEDIDNVIKSMPEKVGALKGATEIHELVFEADGKIKMKKMPNEAFYNSVKINTGKVIVRKERVNLDKGFIEETNEESVQEHEEVDGETENRRERMRLRTRIARFDDMEDELVSESDSDGE